MALWRDRPDGGLEVATAKDGWVYRYLVHDDGATTVIESIPPLPTRRFSQPLQYGGFGLFLVALIANVAGKAEFDKTFFILVGIGMAMTAVGALLEEDDMKNRLTTSIWHDTDEWHEAMKLNGWAPRTSAQLAAVEQLAEEHHGVAKVRDRGGRTVDVRIRRWGQKRYEVDQSGQIELADSEWPKDNGLPWLEVRTREEPDN
jgi:hypothetical protein